MSEAAEAEDYLPSYETEDARRAWRRRTSLEMIISGFIGLVTSFVLSIEAWQLAADSSARFGCDISSVLSCSAVAQTWQARILGFPNAFLGIFFEAVVLAISVAIFAGAVPMVPVDHPDDNARLRRNHSHQYSRWRHPGARGTASYRRPGPRLGPMGSDRLWRARHGGREVRAEASRLRAGRRCVLAVIH